MLLHLGSGLLGSLLSCLLSCLLHLNLLHLLLGLLELLERLVSKLLYLGPLALRLGAVLLGLHGQVAYLGKGLLALLHQLG
ncbi:hypothetical protein SY88_07315 [Clostridiales bacterium PH28_bin88]|nr:hypothetical protein SY88_07315 [Clostridiales bacterium PH28_bin88]